MHAEAAEPDAEVSFVTKDLAPILPKAKLAAVVAIDEVLMRVRDASNWRGSSGVRYAALANAAADATGAQSELKLAYANEGTAADPYAGFETRVVPENVTLLPKTKEQVTGGNPSANACISSRKATPSPRSCVIRALRPKRRERSPRRLARAAATAD